MNGWLTVGLLVISNIFMTFAWYGQLKLQQMKVITSHTPLITVILLSWGIALMEYMFMVPANRYGFNGNGGQFSLLQLKVIQEVISLMIFTVFTIMFFRGEALHWNHFLAFCLLIVAVYLVFMES
ncbi:DMT family protein [uncultured Duncaniella sp.]|uniref:DMT family protein n=1 Tax=uncultured Duncaniella sp. TaxID=2768039 RepID=UPI002674608C|nr:DMT family protein [uncultured Duncaniella sp.]MCI9172844.1 DMT family protein [Muribaculaceae bacterium]